MRSANLDDFFTAIQIKISELASPHQSFTAIDKNSILALGQGVEGEHPVQHAINVDLQPECLSLLDVQSVLQPCLQPQSRWAFQPQTMRGPLREIPVPPRLRSLVVRDFHRSPTIQDGTLVVIQQLGNRTAQREQRDGHRARGVDRTSDFGDRHARLIGRGNRRKPIAAKRGILFSIKPRTVGCPDVDLIGTQSRPVARNNSHQLVSRHQELDAGPRFQPHRVHLANKRVFRFDATENLRRVGHIVPNKLCPNWNTLASLVKFLPQHLAP